MHNAESKNINQCVLASKDMMETQKFHAQRLAVALITNALVLILASTDNVCQFAQHRRVDIMRNALE